MYQSFASVEKDDPNRTSVMRKGPTFLYVEADNLDETIAALKDVPVVMPERMTFYGAKEIGRRATRAATSSPLRKWLPRHRTKLPR